MPCACTKQSTGPVGVGAPTQSRSCWDVSSAVRLPASSMHCSEVSSEGCAAVVEVSVATSPSTSAASNERRRMGVVMA